jgi:hypothetical protein
LNVFLGLVVLVIRFPTTSFGLLVLVRLFPCPRVDGESGFPAGQEGRTGAEEGEDEVLVGEDVTVLVFDTGAYEGIST